MRERALEKCIGDESLQVGRSKGVLDLCLDNLFEDCIWGQREEGENEMKGKL